jgi:hypothetical protein
MIKLLCRVFGHKRKIINKICLPFGVTDYYTECTRCSQTRIVTYNPYSLYEKVSIYE